MGHRDAQGRPSLVGISSPLAPSPLLRQSTFSPMSPRHWSTSPAWTPRSCTGTSSQTTYLGTTAAGAWRILALQNRRTDERPRDLEVEHHPALCSPGTVEVRKRYTCDRRLRVRSDGLRVSLGIVAVPWTRLSDATSDRTCTHPDCGNATVEDAGRGVFVQGSGCPSQRCEHFGATSKRSRLSPRRREPPGSLRRTARKASGLRVTTPKLSNRRSRIKTTPRCSRSRFSLSTRSGRCSSPR